jgi:hypothetical protein
LEEIVAASHNGSAVIVALGKRKLSGREKDEASVKLLEKLRVSLYSSDSSAARQAAFKLSWMQEDGFDILQEALLGRSSRRTKYAAAYGLRSMHGRMKKMALNLLERGSKHRDRDIKNVCNQALTLLSQRARKRTRSQAKTGPQRFEIKQIQGKRRRRGRTARRPERRATSAG